MIRKIHVAAAAACVLAISAALAAGPPPMSDSADIARIGVAPGIDRIEPAAPTPPTCAPNSGVKVPTGATLCGLPGASGSNTFAYEGIQYATASRWIGPKAFPPPSSGTVNQTAFGPFCPQSVAGVAAGAEAEACLYLNVWAPATAINTSAKLPVMVFIHGGAFITGRGSAPTFDGSALAAKGAVVVTLNYRLGALGFLFAKTKGVSSPGNLGLMDQQAALNWVHSYISSFGGDKTNVTLFGESAGAMSVGLHTFDIPSSIGLFQKAVMESNPMAEEYHPRTTLSIAATAVSNQFLLYLCAIWSAEQTAGGKPNPSCDSSSNWQNSVSVADIVNAQLGFLNQPNSVVSSRTNAEIDIAEKYIGLRSLPWQPVVDKQFVVDEPYNGYATYGKGKDRKTMPVMPIMLGVNAQEGVLFAAGLNAGLWNGGKMQQQRAATPAQGTYDTLMKYSFSSPPGGSYLPSALQPTVFYSARGTSLADIITDYSFICGNWFAANNAVRATGAKPLYAYYFSALPLSDSYYPDDLGACVNSVCHGGELPFVFNTLAYGLSKSGSTGPVPAPDQALADAMTNAWFAFASTGNPGWTAYSAASSNATVFTASTTTIAPASTIALGPKGQCSTVWNQYAPYN